MQMPLHMSLLFFWASSDCKVSSHCGSELRFTSGQVYTAFFFVCVSVLEIPWCTVSHATFLIPEEYCLMPRRREFCIESRKEQYRQVLLSFQSIRTWDSKWNSHENSKGWCKETCQIAQYTEVSGGWQAWGRHRTSVPLLQCLSLCISPFVSSEINWQGLLFNS